MIFNQLVEDIREEPCLWSLKKPVKQEDQDTAWLRVATKNKLSAVEVKLIFRELSKKYKEERKKPKSAWKLLDSLRFLDEDLQKNDAEKFKPPTPQKPQQLQVRPHSQLRTPTEDVKVKDEPDEGPHEEVRNNVPHNTSEEDYIELLEVREDDYSEDDAPPDDDMMDMDEDFKTVETKQIVRTTYEKPTTTTPTILNKSNAVLNPAALGNLIPKSDTTAASSTATSTTSTIGLSPSMTQRKIPLIFSGIKRKMANGGGGQMSISITGKVAGQPPEKQSKTDQDKTLEKQRLSPASPVPERAAPTPQTAIAPKETTENIINVVNTQLASPTKAEIGSNSINSTSIEVVRMETENSVNIGDVISLPTVDRIKVEGTDTESDSEFDRITLQNGITVVAPSRSSRSSSLCENETAIQSQTLLPLSGQSQNNVGSLMQPPQRQPTPSTPHSRMYDSFGQYVANTLNALPERLANKLEIKVLEAIIAINTEKM